MLNIIKSSLFGREHTQSRKENKEIRRWAEIEFGNDADYAEFMVNTKSLEELQEDIKR